MRRSPLPRVHQERRLLAALGLATLFHGGLLVSGSFRRTYDAYVHIFFADHYARGWFTTWEPRWYTGFTTTSYPPGSHQALALTSRVVGLEWAFVAVQLFAILGLVVGVYRFSRIWVRPEAAGWAAILAVVSSSIAEAVHTFGQLPTTFSLAFLLNAMPFAFRWVAWGHGRALVLAVACTAATTAGHHVTTLFGSVFFLGPVVATALLDRLRTPLDDESDLHPRRVTAANAPALVARRLRRVLPATVRAGMYGAIVVTTLLFVVLPYWLWSSSDPITQIPIPHASRADFLSDTNAGLVFWAVPWGALLLVLPMAIARGLTSRAWPLTASVLLLTLLGTGGTTPIPRFLLGGAFDVLTLDRFTFWATIAVLPMAGWVLDSLQVGGVAAAVRAQLGRRALPVIRLGVALGFVGMAVFAADLAAMRRFQPDPIDPAPISQFMAKDQHDRWRYLALGFGDQMAWLSTNTDATTVDGNYHSARRLPELTSTPVERLEGAKYRGVPGIGSLQQFLAVPGKYHLKFVFSNDRFYDPLLAFSGWHRLEVLANGIQVWEREDIAPLPTELPSREIPGWQRALWGTVPIGSIVLATLALGATACGARLPRRVSVLFADAEAVARRTSPARWWSRADRTLATLAAAVDGEPVDPRWQSWRRRVDALPDRLLRPPSRRTRRLGAAVLVLAASGVGLVAMSALGRTMTPRDTVEAYYGDIDFSRLAEAHARLDPDTRPDLDQFLLERSVTDGLVASYGKLERIETTLLAGGAAQAKVRADLSYVTSLDRYEVTTEHDLVRRGGRWYLAPERSDATIPPDQFVRRTSIDFLSQGRRRVTVATTAFADILDRPETATVDARLLRVDGRWVLVGEVVNTDVDPADVTVTGQILDADGGVLAQWDAAQITLHKLLPKERAPFRIEFEGIAGALDVRDPTAGEFTPGASTALRIDADQVAGFALYTKAVVTARELDRPLQVQDARIIDVPGGRELVGTLRNDGTVEVTIPRLLVTTRDRNGRILWVDRAYLETAIRPQRSVEFRVPLAATAGIEPSDLPGAIYDNGLTDLADAPPTATPFLTVDDPAAGGIDVMATGFTRSVA